MLSVQRCICVAICLMFPDGIAGQHTTQLSERCTFYSKLFCEKYNTTMGGESAKPKEFPHMALIGYGEHPSRINWQCGGSLISDRYVLSAAHCTYLGAIGVANYVRLGDLNIASDIDDARPQQFNIIERINHPEYRPPELYNDIALYKLDRNVTFNAYVLPVCLYQRADIPEGFLVATGWRRLEFAGPTSTILMKVNLKQFETSECSRLLTPSKQFPRGIDGSSMICAGETHGSRACQDGTEGALLHHRNLQSVCLASQVGVTVFGGRCGLADSRGVYTRVANYIPWIETVLSSENLK